MAHSWLDDLRPASFRGVPFFVESHQYVGGRRVVFHEFPNKDKPYPEDMGKVGSTFKIDGYLLGDDVKTQRDKMRVATETEGPADLVHPYLGTIKVQCGAFGIDDVKSDGRYTKISFQFYEAGDNEFPNNTDDKQEILEAKAADSMDASKSFFDKNFSVAGLPGFAVDTARASVSQAADAFQKATKGLALQADQISNLAFSIRDLKAETETLIASPALLSKKLQDSFGLLVSALGGGKNAYQAASLLTGFQTQVDPAPYNTPSRTAEKNNKTTFDNFMQQTAIATAALAASTTTFTSTDETLTVRQSLVDNLETQIIKTPDDQTFQTLEDLKAQVSVCIPDADTQLPNVQNYEVKATVPSVVLAYDLFENLDSEQDIIDRNKIRNPAFILGGQSIEVLDVRESA